MLGLEGADVHLLRYRRRVDQTSIKISGGGGGRKLKKKKKKISRTEPPCPHERGGGAHGRSEILVSQNGGRPR